MGLCHSVVLTRRDRLMRVPRWKDWRIVLQDIECLNVLHMAKVAEFVKREHTQQMPETMAELGEAPNEGPVRIDEFVPPRFG